MRNVCLRLAVTLHRAEQKPIRWMYTTRWRRHQFELSGCGYGGMGGRRMLRLVRLFGNKCVCRLVYCFSPFGGDRGSKSFLHCWKRSFRPNFREVLFFDGCFVTSELTLSRYRSCRRRRHRRRIRRRRRRHHVA